MGLPIRQRKRVSVVPQVGGGFGVFRPEDGDDVEARGEISPAMFADELDDRGAQLFPLSPADRVLDANMALGGSGADFDKNQKAAVEGDEVDFPLAVGAVAGKDFHALSAQITGGVAFTPDAQRSLAQVRDFKQGIPPFQFVFRLRHGGIIMPR